MTVNLLLYFALGILSDLLVTGYTLSASRGRAWFASGLSILIAVLNFYILDRVLIADPNWYYALAYAIGNGLGCLLIMKAGRKREDRSKAVRQ